MKRDLLIITTQDFFCRILVKYNFFFYKFLYGLLIGLQIFMISLLKV